MQHYSTLQNTNYTTPQLQLQLQLHYASYITLQYITTTTYNYNSTTLQLQLQLQLHHTTSNSCGEVTTATIATIPENTTPTTFRSVRGFVLPSVSHNIQPFL